LETGQRPQCVSSDYLCTPRLKGYKERLVQDVDERLDLLYVKYQCTGTDGCFFSTVSSSYLHKRVKTTVLFPFITSHKTGY
ncbi:hypothetical protein JG687_00017488, partial [Phytophthora cactorum]